MSHDRHVAVHALLRFFEVDHLREDLQVRSRPFQALAHALANDPALDGPELTVALRKLLEAKDAAVRAAL